MGAQGPLLSNKLQREAILEPSHLGRNNIKDNPCRLLIVFSITAKGEDLQQRVTVYKHCKKVAIFYIVT